MSQPAVRLRRVQAPSLRRSDVPETPVDPEVESQRARDIWTVFLAVRVTNAVSVATFFQPDEFYQALEPAWQIAFGGSGWQQGAWITWEWQHQLRSSLYPYAISLLYRSVAAVSWLLGFPPSVEARMLILLPPVLMAASAAVMEYSTWHLSEKIYGKASRESWAVIAMLLLNPWQWFVSTRTLSNGLEASLTAAALSLWPWRLLDSRATSGQRTGSLSSLRSSLLLAGLACILRPTNALIWVVLAVYTLLKASVDEAVVLVRSAGIYGPAVLIVTGAIDRLYYGSWVFPPAKWLHYNLTRNLAVFYGTNRPDYYLTEGLPLLLTTSLPFALWGIYKSITTFVWSLPGQQTIPPSSNPAILRPLAAIVLTSTAALSLISHKEVRFIYPLLPALTLLAAKPVIAFFAPFPNPSGQVKKLLLLTLISINVALAIYAGSFHQRGVIKVMHDLRQEWERPNINLAHDHYEHLTVAFLMPCHSTPWRSYMVHGAIDAWALTCEPPLHVALAERSQYLDEADVFYNDPVAWLQSNMASVSPPRRWSEDIVKKVNLAAESENKRPWPRHLVFFEQLLNHKPYGQTVQRLLMQKGYRECWRAWNSHFHDDWRRTGDVVVYCIRPEEELRDQL